MDIKNKVRLWNFCAAIAIDIAFSKMRIGLGLAFIPIWVAGIFTISIVDGLKEGKKKSEDTTDMTLE